MHFPCENVSLLLILTLKLGLGVAFSKSDDKNCGRALLATVKLIWSGGVRLGFFDTARKGVYYHSIC